MTTGDIPHAQPTTHELAQEASKHLAQLTRVIGMLQSIAARAASDGTYPSTDPAVIDARLTPRENHVLSLLLNVYSNRRIARTLELSESTVKNHMHAIFLKLDVSDRTEAIATVLRNPPVVLPGS